MMKNLDLLGNKQLIVLMVQKKLMEAYNKIKIKGEVSKIEKNIMHYTSLMKKLLQINLKQLNSEK